MRYRMTVAIAAAAAILLSGCGKETRVPTYPVTGKVYWGTTPAAGALVVFHPEKPLPEGVAKPRGEVKADGTFKLTTYDTGDGAPEGNYKVTVQWWQTASEDLGPTNRLPARYSTPGSSGLTAAVGKAPADVPTFTLNP